MWIECVKDVYEPATNEKHSGMGGASFGNIVAGGLIGVAIDSASGADNKYDGTVNISLVPSKDPNAKADLPAFFNGGKSN